MTLRSVQVLGGAVLCILLQACTSTLKSVTATPQLSPTDTMAALPVERAPENSFPAQAINSRSTWSDRSANLFLSKRAINTGDILTVQISINDSAQLSNRSNRKRTGSKSLGLAGAFDIAGAGTSANANASLESDTVFNGNGGVSRSESINVRVAALVREVLPNGNLVISGSQEVLVNSELRFLTITGIVRPADILPDNTISYERIAEARISYGGQGRISEVQQPGYGQVWLDRLSPL
ncbi:MAG: flagellar basal body L-ring protein FlgH [Rhizobiaceae bacterium]